jgi:hypothetical protein
MPKYVGYGSGGKMKPKPMPKPKGDDKSWATGGSMK